MRRILLSLSLAIAGLFLCGSLAPALPAAHAQAAKPTVVATPNPVQVGGSASITGQSFTPNNWAYVSFHRPDGTTSSLFVPTTATGTLSFTLAFSAAHGTGNESLTAYDYGTGRWSEQLAIAVVSGAPIPVRQLTTSVSTAAVSTTTTVSGAGFTANTWAYVYFQRPDRTAGAFWIWTGGAGRFASLLGFNATYGCGTETLWAYDYATGNWSAPTTVSVTGCGSPAAPSDLKVVSTNVSPALPQPATVALQWRDNSANETGFRIRTTITRFYGGTDTQTQEAGANATTAAVNFIAGGFNPVKSVCFTVTAFNATSESAPSNSACVQLTG